MKQISLFNMFVNTGLLIACFLIWIFAVNGEGGQEECGKYKELMDDNNNIVDPSYFPWLGLISYEDGLGAEESLRCTAVLISNRYLITNAHCFKGDYIIKSVVLGKYNRDTRETEGDCSENGVCAPKATTYEIEEIVLHPGYKIRPKFYTHDIALIRLKNPVIFNEYIQPICLPDSKDVQAKELMYVGWNRNSTIESRKTQIKATIIENSVCKETYKLTLLEWFLCATCTNFLSGSPLMNVIYNNGQPHHYTLIGLSSFGTLGCSTEFYDVLTDIREYVDWIKYNMYNYTYTN